MPVSNGAKKLKIAFVFDRYHPNGRGEGYFSWLIGELSKKGHEVHIFASMAGGKPLEGYLHKIPIVRYPRSLMIISFLVNSARAIRRNDFGVVHGVGRCLHMTVFNPHGGVEKAYLRQEFRSISNGFYFLYQVLRRYISFQHYLKIWIQKKQYLGRDVRRIIAISQMVKRDIISYYGVPEEKIAVVTNCVDLERFHPRNRTLYLAEKRTELGLDTDTLVLLFAGNNYRLKGLEPLIDAFALLHQRFPKQPLRLLVAGRGQISRYTKIATKLGVRDDMIFLGPVPHMEQYYAASDIYVHPTFYDPCSLTVLEALASGLPVITTRFNGAADVMISDMGGKVIEDPTNVEGLAQSIALFFDKDRRNQARLAARQWMESYPPDRHVDQILRIYYEALGQT